MITIGVPTYNRPDDLRRCLKELTEQTYPHLEIIVSDNASPDPRVEQVLEEAAKDERVRVVRQTTNIGATLNFQFLLDEAKGDFFLWAGDDDFRAPAYIEKLLAGFEASPHASISFCNFLECTSDGAPASGYPPHLAMLRGFESRYRWLRLLRYFWTHEGMGKAHVIYGLYRREALKSLDWMKFIDRHGTWGADMLFAFQMLTVGPIVVAPEILYRATVGNTKHYESSRSRDSLFSRLKIRWNLWKTLTFYVLRYPSLTPAPERILIATLLPAKVFTLTVRVAAASLKRSLARRFGSKQPT